MKTVDCIIYSKDRACQLDLLLRSIKDKFKNVGEVYLLYTYSTKEFEAGYDRIASINYGLNINPILQKNFQEDVLNILKIMKSPFVLGLCDDDVFIKEVDCSNFIGKLYDSDVSAISLKAGLNIIGNYPGIPFDLPQFLVNDNYLMWEWRKCHPESDWGYPTCINSYIFLKSYFIGLVSKIQFNRPTNLEGGLNSIRFMFRDLMFGYTDLKVLNILANKVQDISPAAVAKKHVYSVEDLNKKFLNGYGISTTNIYNYPALQGNVELEFKFEK